MDGNWPSLEAVRPVPQKAAFPSAGRGEAPNNLVDADEAA